MKIFIVFYISILSFDTIGQIKGDYHWIGGVKEKGYIFDFNQKNPIPQKQVLQFGYTGNNTSISDQDGKLLFYFNGCAVMNRLHQVMPNGDSINKGSFFELFWRGDCIYGYPGFQETLILQDPSYPDGYYLFHKPNMYYPMISDSFQLHYTYIDMKLDNGNGDVVIKNQQYYEKEDLMYSFFTAIKHSNQLDWWVIQPVIEDSIFLTFAINDEKGIVRYPNQNSHQFFNKHRTSAGGTAKFSPDGTKYALYTYTDQLHVYDFDRETGLLSNHQKININDPDSIDYQYAYFSSVEWSPNSRFVYCASSLRLHQVDMWESDPQDGVRFIDKYNGTLDPFPNELNIMAQAPDCKIYMTPKNGSYSIHVINKPDELGKDCDFVQNGIKLPAQNSGTLPNFPRFRVDEVDKCDPTITSVFGDDVYFRRDIEIYPNPSSGIFQIKIPETLSIAKIMVTDINGQLLFQKEINRSTIEEIDLTNFPSGRYNIELYPIVNKQKMFYGRQVVKI